MGQLFIRFQLQVMKLDKIYIPKIKVAALLEKKVTEPSKRTPTNHLIQIVKYPLISDTERLFSPTLRGLGYTSKRAKKGGFQSFRTKSLKTPTNFCLQNITEFQQKKNTKNLAIQLLKIESLKRQLVALDSQATNRFGNNLLKISTSSLIARQKSRNARKMSRTSEVSDQSSGLSQNAQSIPFDAQYQPKQYNFSSKKYAQLTFKEIMEIESDEQSRLRSTKLQKKRKVKTQHSENSRK